MLGFLGSCGNTVLGRPVRHAAAIGRLPSRAAEALSFFRSLIGAPNQTSAQVVVFGTWHLEIARSAFGGVPDSTLGWIAPLPVEDEGWPR